MATLCSNQDIVKWFRQHVEKRGEDECWPWREGLTGGSAKSRYGGKSFGGRIVYAHRVAYEQAHGPIPDGLSVMHSCDRPTCCNPVHLRLGTQLDNIRDMHSKGRARKAKGEGHGNARLTKEQAIAIYEDTRPADVVAASFDVGITAVRNIKRGETWSHATGAEYYRPKRRYRTSRGILDGHPAQEFSPAQIRAFEAIAGGDPRPKCGRQAMFDMLEERGLVIEHVDDNYNMTYSVPDEIYDKLQEWTAQTANWEDPRPPRPKLKTELGIE